MPVLPFDVSLEGLKKLINDTDHVIFSKTSCPFCTKAKNLYKAKNIQPTVFELDKLENGQTIQAILYELTGQRTVPSIFAFGNHLGGCDDVHLLDGSRSFEETLGVYQQRKSSENHSFEYDVAIIGGGSGGIACAKEFAEHGMKAVLFDFVVPSPMGTKWGLGGTCVNVGCIPKKLMHQAAIHGHNIVKSKHYGFVLDQENVTHDWSVMRSSINNYIRSLNFGYRNALRDVGVTYINALARISGQNEVTHVDAKQKEGKVTAKYIVIATGERPQPPLIPGGEHCISSDDLFWLKYPPGKTLVIGASYVALECAGALQGMGFDVTVMVRSIFLRGYDQEMANRVGAYMEAGGVKFIKECVPVSVDCLDPVNTDTQLPGTLRVTYKPADDKLGVSLSTDEFNTVMFAIGRVSCTTGIGLETVGVVLDSKKRVVAVDNREQTHCPNVFAVGDVLSGRPQLTPVAIKAGQLLARRLCKKSFENCDYSIVPTTVFTPLEYGAIGYSEEDAIAKFGDEDIDVYYNYCEPLEEAIVDGTDHNNFYAKIICRVSQQNRVIGLHIVSPNAGEITQGYSVAMRMGANLTDFRRTFGIHPTVSEVFTNMKVSKKSGKSIVPGGC